MHEQPSSPSDQDIELASRLDSLQRDANDGRGISAVRTVASLLNSGNREAASAAISSEWDKISSYPEVANLLVNEGLFTPYDPSKHS